MLDDDDSGDNVKDTLSRRRSSVSRRQSNQSNISDKDTFLVASSDGSVSKKPPQSTEDVNISSGYATPVEPSASTSLMTPTSVQCDRANRRSSVLPLLKKSPFTSHEMMSDDALMAAADDEDDQVVVQFVLIIH